MAVTHNTNYIAHAILFFVYLVVFIVWIPSHCVASRTHKLDWKVQYANVTRLCHTKALVSINGQFPGPTVYVREGDTVIVNVTNLVSYNITIHWHGVRQLLTAWADGPAYITQCPIQTGKSYVHKFKIIDQRGTLFYHAHISWLRATVHGAFIIQPRDKVYPFTAPKEEIPILIGEWWNDNTEDVVAEALASGAGYQLSDAITINGQPGSQYGNCSVADTPIFNITSGKTYLIRIINAAVNFQMFVGVTNHTLTVVEVDAEYTKPYTTNTIVIAPGQTTNVLLTANQPPGHYVLAATVFSPADESRVPFPRVQATTILSYTTSTTTLTISSLPSLQQPSFPIASDTNYALNFTQSLRGQPFNKGFYYYQSPDTIDENLFFTLNYNLNPCPNCTVLGNQRISTSINNVTFKDPKLSLLQAYYNHINGTYDLDFPSQPLFTYNYTGQAPSNLQSVIATKVKVLNFSSNVQIVFQDTSNLLFESHPIHLHGQNFYIVGSGLGTFNASRDTPKFNLVDPPSRNTVAVPSGGWAVVRFRTTNPGVWFMHCHFDIHSVWGMSMAFIVKNGQGPLETLPPPPKDLPPC